jgi:UDP:flavonoid glycosyltransferase YjiC (YdhE family)
VKEIACFITPHGYGHAGRTIAVLEALHNRCQDLHAHLLTTVPEAFFNRLPCSHNYHPERVDLGLVQQSAFHADLQATLDVLDRLLPFSSSQINRLARRLTGCSLVLCDIAPLGILVAEAIQKPSVLVENFTWDWIYNSYSGQYPGLNKHREYLGDIYSRASLRIQAEPCCRLVSGAVHCSPVFRKTRGNAKQIRDHFHCRDTPFIVVTMGGVGHELPALDQLKSYPDYTFVLAGQPAFRQVAQNIFLLNADTELYHPDLIAAADAVVCKAGYSTIAECFQAGSRIISVGRDDFSETPVIQNFVKTRLDGVGIDPAAYARGEWLPLLEGLLVRPKPVPCIENGAGKVADILKDFI